MLLVAVVGVCVLFKVRLLVPSSMPFMDFFPFPLFSLRFSNKDSNEYDKSEFAGWPSMEDDDVSLSLFFCLLLRVLVDSEGTLISSTGKLVVLIPLGSSSSCAWLPLAITRL